MGTASFFLTFLVVGIFGVEALTRTFETLPSEQIGAFGFLFLLCLVTSAISTLCYAENSRRLGRRARWSTGLLGGVIAATAFCATVGAGYAFLQPLLDHEPVLNALGFWFWVALLLALPILIGWLWPFVSAKAPEFHN
jgi:MFS family permease